MKARVLLSLAFMTLFLPALASAKDVWTEVRSKNFLLVGNADEKDIRRVGAKLEQFRETFRQLFPKANFSSVTPTTVVVFKNNEAYKPFKPIRANGKTDDFVAGYFQPGLDINYITLSTEGESNEAYGIIFHEYVHFIVNNNFGRATVPPWFNEGLAEYYQTFRLENDQRAILGELQIGHLRLLQQQELIPFEKFFNVDYYSLQNQGNHGKNIFYAQAWALLHYLQQSNKGARREQLTKFLGLLLSHKPPREAFQEAFQIDYATMEKELKRYVEQRSFTGSIVTLKDKLSFDAEMRSAPLSEAEAAARLGDLLLHTHRLEDAKARLVQALALDSNSAMAHASLGMAFVRQNNFAAAKQHLEKAVELNAKNYLSHFYYAYALSREDMDASGYVRQYLPIKASKMTNALERAIELNPSFPESYRLLAFINMVNGVDLDGAIAALKKALALEPGNQQYALDLGQIYLRKEEFDTARDLVRRVFSSAENADVRSQAQLLLANINSYEAQLKSYQQIKEDPDAKPRPQQPQLSEEELVNQALNEALRKLRAGEKRAVGFLTEINCDSKGVTLSVRTEAETLKLFASEFQKITLVAFTAEANGKQFGCGARKPEEFVIATYRPDKTAKANPNGEIVALEFMPKSFKLIE